MLTPYLLLIDDTFVVDHIAVALLDIAEGQEVSNRIFTDRRKYFISGLRNEHISLYL
jgi:hypothetical protein